MSKYVYMFSEGNGSMRELLGGKGANLAEMSNLGLPVPQGFTITTEVCTKYYNEGKTLSDDVKAQIFEALAKIENMTGKKLGDDKNPLLVSVRSGARASMPGMMDTILNLGLNDQVVEVVANLTGNPRFAYDSYRRFIQMYSDVVMEVEKSNFEKIIDKMKEEKGVKLEGRICPVCNRTMMPQWKECMFCKAGIGFEGGGAKKGVAPTRAAKDKKEEPQGRICPDCGRPMKAHWTTCLYCEADASSRPQSAPPKEEPKPQENVRICPDCGRPMKAHWTVCLYCEANRARD